MIRLHRFVIRALGPSAYSRSSLSTSTVPDGLDKKSDSEPKKSAPSQNKSRMVAAVFDSLQQPDRADEINQRILAAKNVKDLLSVADSSAEVTRKHALQVVSILAEWSSINRAKLSEFENDARFIKLCRQLGRAPAKPGPTGNAPKKFQSNDFRTEDVNMVLSIAGDDEASTLVATLSIPQMIRVMSALALKKRRSTPLLRSLSFHISSSSERLNLKQCGDLLFAMAVLNFPDSVLIARVGMDIQNGLAENQDKPAVVGSIVTSLGLLKFRNSDLLENLTDWMVSHREICRPQDISSLLLTLATLNYPTSQADRLKSTLVKSITENDFSRSFEWLNHVWALVILDFAEGQHFESVLKKEFIEKLVIEKKSDLSATMKMKLLNINAAAKCLKPKYDGPVLAEDSQIFSVPLAHSKSKNVLFVGLLDALKNLFTSDSLLRTVHDSRMGFVIDAECVLDKKGNPLPVNQEHKDATRVAIMVRDFHDFCQGVHQQPSGVSALAHRLLEQAGYKILMIPYNEFNTSDKVIKRVQYLEEKLKRIVS